MVRRWDFSENEWACRDLLIADFPDAVRRWTAEELEEVEGIGESAAKMLLELIDGKPVPGGKIRLETELVIGESVHKLS